MILSGSSALGELLSDANDWIRYKADSCKLEAYLHTAKKEERIIKLEIHRDDKLSQIISRNKESLKILDDAIDHAQRNYLTIGYGVHRRIGGGGFSSKSSSYNSDRS